MACTRYSADAYRQRAGGDAARRSHGGGSAASKPAPTSLPRPPDARAHHPARARRRRASRAARSARPSSDGRAAAEDRAPADRQPMHSPGSPPARRHQPQRTARACRQRRARWRARKLPIIAVGPGTAQLARELGFARIIEGSGTADRPRARHRRDFARTCTERSPTCAARTSPSTCEAPSRARA